MRPYDAAYRPGTWVEIRSAAELRDFQRRWHHHHPLSEEQARFAMRRARVEAVGFYHGGDPLYRLHGVPGVWHEVCLRVPTCDLPPPASQDAGS